MKQTQTTNDRIETKGEMMTEQEMIDAAIAEFPETFGLRGYRGDTFRISRRASYVSSGMYDGVQVRAPRVLLYTQIQRDGEWVDFAKGDVSELRGQIVTKGE